MKKLKLMNNLLNYLSNNKNQIVIFFILFFVILLIHYLKLYHFLGHHSFSSNFVDWEFIRGFAKCSIEGKNRFIDLSCDIMERRVAYPPLWIYTPKIFYYFDSNFIFLASLSFFIYISLKFIEIKNISEFFLIFFLFTSPYFLYGFHRLNIDIFLVPVIFYSVYLIKIKKNILSSAIIIFCSFLKLYPAITYLIFLKQNKKVFYSIVIVSMIFLILHLVFHLKEIQIMLSNSDMTGGPGNGSFSGKNLLYFISIILVPEIGEQNSYFMLGSAILIVVIYLLLPSSTIQKNNEMNINEIFFIAGFLILVFCFIFSYNINYRFMYILLLIPLFLDKDFVKRFKNKNFIILFLFLFFFKSHINTVLGNIAILEYQNLINTKVSQLFKENSQYSYFLNLIDAIIQWIMMGILIYLFKKNNLKSVII